MIVRRDGDVIVIEDPAYAWAIRWILSLLFLAIAWGCLASATTGFRLLGVLLGLAGIAVLVSPLLRTEIDPRRREFRRFKRWPWGKGRAQVVSFDEVERVQLDVQEGEDGAECYFPQLVLKSGRTLGLSSAGAKDKREGDGAVSLAREAMRRRS